MARGFWTGLLHGAVVGGLGLMALSLLVPLPKSLSDENALQPSPSPDVVSQPQPSGPDASAGSPYLSPADVVQESDSSDQHDNRPQAAVIDLPEGSDFGRGGEAAPVLPAQIEPRSQQEMSEPPAVALPVSEPEPVTATGEDLRPDIAMPGNMMDDAVRAPLQSGETLTVDIPASQAAPAAGDTPGIMDAASQDRLPTITAGNGVVWDDRVANPEKNDDNPGSGHGISDSVPVMPTPGLDLSTPPDLSELRSLQRE